ncbi:hypothetical protein [Wolbachia endosymbiont of Psylliodes chrysocephala]|uniref:hypothetical protein n=1 Tax=Wolbachia endosymbiont of Psylliodes chrysocephala TaxID=2883236 RepID=UPI00209E180B|nr:hypothetical protein [Wolbachia endosymbiont of Psylliodes chrysocephala]
MVAILNVTKGKNKVITSGLVGALSALIFLTAIHIAAKIAIIVSAAAVAYLLLLLIHKIRTKKEQPAEITGVSEDEGYSSVDEGEEKDTVEESEKTEAELEEEIIRKRAEEKMKNGLPEHMDLDGNSLAGADDTSQTRYATNYMDLMRSPPMHMNGYYQEITKVASAPKTFVTSDSMRMPERLTMEDIVNQRG